MFHPRVRRVKHLDAILRKLSTFKNLNINFQFQKKAISFEVTLESKKEIHESSKVLKSLQIFPAGTIFYFSKILGELSLIFDPLEKKKKNPYLLNIVKKIEEKLGLEIKHLFWDLGEEIALGIYPYSEKTGIIPETIFLLETKHTAPFKDFLKNLQRVFSNKYPHFQGKWRTIDKHEILTFRILFVDLNISFIDNFLVFGLGFPTFQKMLDLSRKGITGSLGQQNSLQKIFSSVKKENSGMAYVEVPALFKTIERAYKLMNKSRRVEKFKFWFKQFRFLKTIYALEVNNKKALKSLINIELE
ncbi:DUF3352 domain-containing protein [Candidatus Riflebacteria bacterium]